MNERELDPLASTTKYYNLIRRMSFPSLQRVLVEMILTTVVGCGFAFFFSSFSVDGLIFGCLVGAGVFALPSILMEMASSGLLLRDDPLFYLRRCVALSLVTNFVWVAFLVAGGILRGFGGFPQKPFLIGMIGAYSLRSFAIFSLSESSMLRRTVASFAQPLASVAVAFPILRLPLQETAVLSVAAPAVALILLYPLLKLIERRGKETLDVSLMRCFRAFLAVFLDMKREPLEQCLEELGATEDITVDVMVFKKSTSSKPKAVMVVSDFHPGPFLNVGSSVLPVLIQNKVEAETGAIVMVPHGVSGHEHNLVSQSENQKVMELLDRLLTKGQQAATASRVVRSSVGVGSATCQAFGKLGLITFTTSPKNMEDIPREVSSAFQSEPLEFNKLVLIDSHNCIDELSPMTAKDSSDLIASGRNALQEAIRERQHPFKVGASKRALKEFSLEQGIGPGGLSIVMIDVGGHTSGYVTVDGNNMKAGLRERVLNALEAMGVGDAEVMTTDSHMVSGRISSKLGYHPVGQAIDETLFLSLVESAAREALASLEDSDVEWSSGRVRVKTLGRETFENLTQLIRGLSRLVAWWVLGIVLIPILVGLALLH